MRGGDPPLRLRLRPAVGVDRRRLVLLAVAAARAVEDEVAREVDEPEPTRRLGDGRRAVDVHLPLALALDVRGVDHGVDAGDRSADLGRVADVDAHPLRLAVRLVLPPGRAHLPACRGRTPDELATEVPATAGDQ